MLVAYMNKNIKQTGCGCSRMITNASIDMYISVGNILFLILSCPEAPLSVIYYITRKGVPELRGPA